jgi:N-acetylglucosaminyl-diphospho-decaprenol L-rhamnosyltransferase
MNIDVSIIIVNWQVRDLLRACLQSLRDQAGLPAQRYQTIVVDNASNDGSAAMVAAEFPQVQLIANTDNLGFGQANNQALPLCTGRLVLLLNPDTLVLDGAVGRMVALMDAQPAVAVLGCRLLNGDGTLQRWTGGAYPRLLNLVNHYFFLDRLLPSAWRPMPLYLDRDVEDDLPVDWVSGACMMLRASALQGRLFNPDYFMYGEDMELCHRLKQAGGQVVYTPRASIVHFQGESMKQQQGEVLLSSLKGPRQFYRQMRGGRGLWLYDLVTVLGFALRWCLFSLASLGRPALASRAASSRDLMQRAWRVMRG